MCMLGSHMSQNQQFACVPWTRDKHLDLNCNNTDLFEETPHGQVKNKSSANAKINQSTDILLGIGQKETIKRTKGKCKLLLGLCN